MRVWIPHPIFDSRYFQSTRPRRNKNWAPGRKLWQNFCEIWDSSHTRPPSHPLSSVFPIRSPLFALSFGLRALFPAPPPPSPSPSYFASAFWLQQHQPVISISLLPYPENSSSHFSGEKTPDPCDLFALLLSIVFQLVKLRTTDVFLFLFVRM
ncbi:hypothetical protein K1719_014286 [Acacia pycnantha]|nr:hypothetical protein K1719_014286 [Acacia pycnantha]